jgi:hypothetical protein
MCGGWNALNGVHRKRSTKLHEPTLTFVSEISCYFVDRVMFGQAVVPQPDLAPDRSSADLTATKVSEYVTRSVVF